MSSKNDSSCQLGRDRADQDVIARGVEELIEIAEAVTDSHRLLASEPPVPAPAD